MVMDYLTWFVSFVGDAIAWMGSAQVVPGVSLLAFIVAVALLCIIVGGILIR